MFHVFKSANVLLYVFLHVCNEFLYIVFSSLGFRKFEFFPNILLV